MIRDGGKLALFVLIIIMLGVLRYTGSVDIATFRGVLLLVTGYLVGNGVQAIRGKAPSPVMVPANHKVDTTEATAALAAALVPALVPLLVPALTTSAREVAAPS